jgi:hypothetical protein
VERVATFFFFSFISSSELKFKYDQLKHMHQTNSKFEVQHDATFHTSLGFFLLKYKYISN